MFLHVQLTAECLVFSFNLNKSYKKGVNFFFKVGKSEKLRKIPKLVSEEVKTLGFRLPRSPGSTSHLSCSPPRPGAGGRDASVFPRIHSFPLHVPTSFAVVLPACRPQQPASCLSHIGLFPAPLKDRGSSFYQCISRGATSGTKKTSPSTEAAEGQTALPIAVQTSDAASSLLQSNSPS